VIDSMSISARVISNGCIRSASSSTGFSLCGLNYSQSTEHRLKPVLLTQ
jgi:hypothetical protein